MAYTPVSIDPNTPRIVHDFIRIHLDMQFQDIHCMFRLPIPESDIHAGCNFAAANTLLSIVSGCSVTLYEQGSRPRESGTFFKGVLDAFYPWDLESPLGAPKKEAIELLYHQFRNPLAHAFGIDEKRTKRSNIGIGKGTYPEESIEAFEKLTKPTGLIPTIAGTTGSSTLCVEGLYWGVREMLRRLTTDKKRMASAEAYLKKVLA